MEKKVAERREKDRKDKESKMQAARDKADGLRAQLKVGEQRIKQAPSKIKDQKELIEAFNPKIEAARRELIATRDSIQNIKGNGLNEDVNFDINNSRDWYS